mmetsp:Transcript_25487/g.37608  ORF Transcript_25487/g.37608 Transcript_25487/m.37608 type:complete len:1395 (+) Transcript_25487:47-4231(+)
MKPKHSSDTTKSGVSQGVGRFGSKSSVSRYHAMVNLSQQESTHSFPDTASDSSSPRNRTSPTASKGVPQVNSNVKMTRLGSFGSFGVSNPSDSHSIRNAEPPSTSGGSIAKKESFDSIVDFEDEDKNAIVFKAFSIRMKNSEKVLIHPVTATIKSGSMFAIMGGSGSGKTTLLNAIAGRYDRKHVQFSGKLSFEGMSHCTIAYITQDDSFFPHLTVRETIYFVSRMRSRHSSKHVHLACARGVAECESITNDLILSLGLKECADVRIVAGEAGPSGGELRRLSMAVQLVSDPDILCADEITSGLDAFTAEHVVETLRQVTTSKGLKAALCTLHQPRADVFKLFDSVMLISRGHPIYCGKSSEMIGYFSSLGLECPRHCNPADYFIDIISVGSSENGGVVDKERVNKLIQSYSDVVLGASSPTGTTRTTPAPLRYGQSVMHISKISGRRDSVFEKTSFKLLWPQQVVLLLQRFLLARTRNKSNFIGMMAQALVIGLIICFIFWQLEDSYTDLLSRAGLMYVLLSLGPYLLMITLVKDLADELKFFDRERLDHIYSHSAFFTAQMLSVCPILVLHSILYCLPVYLGSNLRSGSEAGWIFFTTNTVISFGMLGIAWFSAACHRSFSISSIIANTQFTFFTLSSGFLVNTKTVPPYAGWISTISFLTYAYKILMANEISDREFTTCVNVSPNSACVDVVYQGNDYLETLDIGSRDHHTMWAVLLPIIILYYILAVGLMICIRPVSNKMNDKKLVKQAMKDSVTPALTTVSNSDVIEFVHSTPRVDIDVLDICLFKVSRVSNPKPGEDKFRIKHILKNVTCKIHHKRMVAIMGGSGSGKTSLLNVISQRNRRPFKESMSISHYLSTFFRSRMYGTGQILFNGEILPHKKVRHTIGLVEQFDKHMPSLTVRETLMFHAQLHMSSSLSLETKQERISSVVDRLGLDSCLDTYVGGGKVKGISGGEMKRVSIGCELLLDPSVCLLDEPTTGLDSFTAARIVKVLRELAHTDGKAVALTIHQPRYDIYNQFDDIILLSKGELIWSGSSQNLLKHFENLGYKCPEFSNPADFIIDTSSINFTSEKKEKKTRKRRKKLVKAYKKSVRRNSGSDAGSQDTHEYPEIHDKSIVYTLPLLLSRAYKNLFRQPLSCVDRVFQALSLALILCLFYAPLDHSQESIQNRIGCLYELTALGFIGMLVSIASFPEQRDVFYREYTSGGYSASAFFISYALQSVPFIITLAFIISALTGYVIKLQPTPEAYWHIFLTVICYIVNGEAMGVMAFSIFKESGVAVDMMSVVLAIFCTLAGFISLNIPLILQYVSYFSPMKWGSVLLANYVFNGESFDCDSAVCPYTHGEEVIEAYEMTYNEDNNGNKQFTIGMLCLVTVSYVLLAYVVFRFRASML